MLYRKTTTAVSAVILGVMALLGATAHAQLDLDRQNQNAARSVQNPLPVVVFSRESLPNLAARQTHYVVRVPAGSQTVLIPVFQFGYPVGRGTGGADGLGGVAIRYDLENLQFNPAAPVGVAQVQIIGGAGTPVTDVNAPRRLAAGGTGQAGSDSRCDGRTCAIFEVGTDANTELPGNAVMQLWSWNGNLQVHPEGAGRMRARVFSNFDSAMEAGSRGLRKDTGTKTIIHIASSVTTRISGGTPAVADVATTPRFTNFAPPGMKPLGGISITLNTAHYLADGTGLVSGLDDVTAPGNNGGIVFTDSTENLGFGNFSLRAGATCPAAGSITVGVPTMGDNAGRGSSNLFVGARTLCVAPKRTGGLGTPNYEIPATVITAAVNYTGSTGRGFAPADMTGTVGTIVRNGATVQLSYLTVSDRYNQRIIITNRSAADAEYELSSFYTEDGTEGAAGETAEGTIPAMSSIVVLTRDAVTFTGARSRGSATMAVTAPASTISVATTQVNLSDGSTDTINYEVMGAGAN